MEMIKFKNGLDLYKKDDILLIEYKGYTTSIPDWYLEAPIHSKSFVREALKEVKIDTTKIYTNDQLRNKAKIFNAVKFIKPNLMDSLLFLQTEVGELTDACIRAHNPIPFARNNKKTITKNDILNEIEDCRMMINIIEERINE